MRLVLPRIALRLALFALLLPAAALARDAYFTTSDRVRLHLIEQGDPSGHTIIFVPGWTIPAWIFKPQLDAFATRYRVVALDPRGQGYSEIAPSGYDHIRRGRDIAELIAALGNRPVLLVGWSLGVLDSLGYVAQYGDTKIAGLVLIDNSIGEEPAPVPASGPRYHGPVLPREEQMRRFVRGMFRTNPGEDYLDRLTEDALRTPPAVAKELGSYPAPRTYWRDAVYSVTQPILYIVRPHFAAQAANLAAKDPLAETVTFATAGHALFVDEAEHFDEVLDDFIRRRVWPQGR